MPRLSGFNIGWPISQNTRTQSDKFTENPNSTCLFLLSFEPKHNTFKYCISPYLEFLFVCRQYTHTISALKLLAQKGLFAYRCLKKKVKFNWFHPYNMYTEKKICHLHSYQEYWAISLETMSINIRIMEMNSPKDE